MKKIEKAIIITLIIVLIIIILLALVIGIKNLKSYMKTRNEILALNFEIPEYKIVEDVIYYDDKEFDDKITENLLPIADKLKSEYQNKKIVLTEISRSDDCFEYTFNQIIGEQIIDKSSVMVSIGNRLEVEYGTVFRENNIVGDDINNVKINREKAIEKFKDYLLEDIANYKELRFAPVMLTNYYSKPYDKLEFYQYKGKAAWKFSFTRGSYVIIDANNGEILDKYVITGPVPLSF